MRAGGPSRGLAGAATMAVVTAGLLPITAAAADPEVAVHVVGDDARARSTSWWTPERRAAATPMPLETPPQDGAGRPGATEEGGKANGGKGGGGKGGGESSSSDTVGEYWVDELEGTDDIGDTAGRLFFTKDGSPSWCSASIVDSPNGNVLVTAGHCVHEGQGAGGFFDDFVFEPAHDDGVAPHGSWAAVAIVTPTEWADVEHGNWYADHDHDVAFVVVEDHDGVSIAEAVGSMPIRFDWSAETVDGHLSVWGYPGSPSGGRYKFDGGDLAHCAGPSIDLDLAEAPNTAGLDCVMRSGSSGGPRLIDFDPATGRGTTVSVTSWSGYLNGVRWGPVFASSSQRAYDVAAGDPSSNATA